MAHFYLSSPLSPSPIEPRSVSGAITSRKGLRLLWKIKPGHAPLALAPLVFPGKSLGFPVRDYFPS